jgi:hypothetical protein
MVLYQICVFGADLKSNMAARVHNVFSLAEILKIFGRTTTHDKNSHGLWPGELKMTIKNPPFCILIMPKRFQQLLKNCFG